MKKHRILLVVQQPIGGIRTFFAMFCRPAVIRDLERRKVRTAPIVSPRRPASLRGEPRAPSGRCGRVAAMRLIHTADWHLGPARFTTSTSARTRRYVLGQLVELVAEVEPAGRHRGRRPLRPRGTAHRGGGPPRPRAHGARRPPRRPGHRDRRQPRQRRARRLRLAAAARARAVPGRASCRRRARPSSCADQHGPVRVSALPYADPAEARAVYGDADIHDQQAVTPPGSRGRSPRPGGTSATCWCPRVRRRRRRERESSGRSASAAPGRSAAGSLRRLRLRAPSATCTGRSAAAGTVRYAGSLLKYSFAEHGHDKSVSVVDIGPRGSAPGEAGQAGRAAVSIETVALSPRRDVRRLEGTLAELLRRGPSDPRSGDYVLASLLDDGALFDPSVACAPSTRTRFPSSGPRTSTPAAADHTGSAPAP